MPEAKASIWDSGAQMNTELVESKRVKMVVPRVERVIPQGWKGYSKAASYRWGEVPSRKPEEHLDRPGSLSSAQGTQGGRRDCSGWRSREAISPVSSRGSVQQALCL